MSAQALRASLLCAGALTACAAQAGDVFNGKQLYLSHCQVCHGADGKGSMPGMRGFSRSGALARPDTALFETVRGGQRAMPGFRGVLENEEIFDVISYLRTLN